MNTNIKNLISITEANQNFSQVARKTDKLGHVIILKNNKPKYYIANINEPILELTEEEKILIVAKRILKKYAQAFQELAR